MRATALRTHRGADTRLLVLRDISEIKRAEQALHEQLAENQALRRKLQQEANRDSLTGLYNRRFLEETLARELARARRTGQTLSVALRDSPMPPSS